MDILESLKKDHEELKAIISRLEMTSNRAARSRQKLLDTLVNTFELHAKTEEQVYYRRFMDDEDGHGLAYEGFEEHKLARMALQDVVRTKIDDEAWMPRFKVYKDVVMHHIEEEESEFFEHSSQCFSDELAELGDRFLEKKNQLQQRSKMRKAG